MSLQILTLLLCLIKPIVSPGEYWTHQQCETRATEYRNAGIHENIDPLFLVAIDIKECQLKDKLKSKKIHGKVDICPMGLRLEDNGLERNGLTRQQVIQRAAQIIHAARRVHTDGNDHHWLTHYNTGVKVYDDGPSVFYATDVLGIYSALQGKSVNTSTLTKRIRGFVSKIIRTLASHNFYRTKSKVG